MPRETFISHASPDRAFVERLVAMLRRHGVPFWYSDINIQGGQQWHDEIGAALGRCDWVVMVLSPAAVRSRWVKSELLYSLRQYRLDQRIVPLLLQDCPYDDLSWTLGAMQMVDFRSDFDAGCRDLLRIWGIGYRGA
ncbi:MAG: toll/interleukin-1 receptor domain-containing protein [Gammaproteobacteria bacterium]|nr:toll/interleukin-1 receptor domain-containing protein [Gammaproteobacteria bacterium]